MHYIRILGGAPCHHPVQKPGSFLATSWIPSYSIEHDRYYLSQGGSPYFDGSKSIIEIRVSVGATNPSSRGKASKFGSGCSFVLVFEFRAIGKTYLVSR